MFDTTARQNDGARRDRVDVWKNAAEVRDDAVDVWDDAEYLEELTIRAMDEPDSEVHFVPPDLDMFPPGPALAAFLSAIEVGLLSGHDQVQLLRAHQRLASHHQARLYQDMTAIADTLDVFDDAAVTADAASAEIRCALRLTRRAADSELDLAFSLRQRLPALWDRLASGEIDVRRAKVVVYGTDHLTIAQAREVTHRALEEAARLTTGQLGALVRRLCLEVDPDHAAERFRATVSERRMTVQATPDGTAHLMALNLPPDRAAAAADHVNRLARALKTKDEPRTIDQLRADVVCDLLVGKETSGRGGVVTLTVDLETLTRLSDRPGDLGGYGPVVSDIARQVADGNCRAEWRFVVTDPGSGALHLGTTRRRPTAAQKRRIHAVNPTCVFPGCRKSASECDLDHHTPYSEHGPTAEANLGPQCRHDHIIKHKFGWTCRRLPDGDYLWTSRLGHTYTTSGRSP
jgi:hypothetical protein